jgi:hypothetical protein
LQLNNSGPEICNGLDDDCNGSTDEGNPGGGKSCFTGLPGICNNGLTSCDGGKPTCQPLTKPVPEACNGLDDDCNGAVDDGNPGGGSPCSTGQPGICDAGITTCAGGGFFCQPINKPVPEACNGLDDDCNGATDEGNPGSGLSCDTGLPGICSKGLTSCANGMLACVQTTLPATEACNALDDDCDGAADDGNPGGGGACSTGQPGPCGVGIMTCAGGVLSCEPATKPVPEVCNNNIDDDCNGKVDDTLCGCTSATFGGHTYLFCPTPSTWSQAATACKGIGYAMVSIGSAQEDNFVFTTANTISNQKWWIGFNDIAAEGNFVWDGGSPVTYTNWEPGEPNDAGGNEDCTQINRYYPKATWNDEPCNQGLFFVCESQ